MSKYTMSREGFVNEVRCGKGHGGNRRIYGPIAGNYECAGCGTHYSATAVVEAMQSAGENGCGSLCRAAA